MRRGDTEKHEVAYTRELRYLEEKAAIEAEAAARKIERRRAQQRLVGSYALGALALWKLITLPERTPEAEGVPWLLVVWLGVALLAFGLASFDQIAKAIGRK